ncbi:undecaprenyl-diphosphatase [Aurantimonas sp. E1-2-R+4]|uniref:undecaprenyl-diphosphatase n=1 Tax=Aurantimonas sp. E1-2-R+4 TaxID=3113714 RepID=UPI002F92D21D
MTITALNDAIVAAAQSALTAMPWLSDLSVATADWGIGILPVVLIVLWLRGGPAGRQTAITATLAAGVALAIAGAISFLFYFPRPFAIGLAPNLLAHVADSSLPSDHAAVMSAVAIALLFAARRLLGVLVAVATLAVGAARVALGVHFPSDILAGILVGGAAAAAFQFKPCNDFASFTRRLAEALYAALGIEVLATRLHLQKQQENIR